MKLNDYHKVNKGITRYASVLLVYLYLPLFFYNYVVVPLDYHSLKCTKILLKYIV